MDAEGISIGIGGGVAIVALKELFAWLRARYSKTFIPQPLNVDGELTTKKVPQYVTVGDCNRRMCEHASDIDKLREEIRLGNKSVLDKLEAMDDKSENRAINLNRRIDPMMEKLAETKGRVDGLEKRISDAANAATIGGKKK